MPKKLKHGEQARAARESGISKQKLGRWYNQGKLDPVIKNKRINVEALLASVDEIRSPQHVQAADARWNKKKNPTQEDVADVAAVAGLDENTSIAEAQRLKAVYDASIRKLELEQKRSDLLEFEAVKKEVGDIVLTFRSQVVSIPDRISAILAAESSRSEVKRLLKTELNTALDAISSKLLEPND